MSVRINKTAGVLAARIAGRSSEIDSAARKVKRKLESEAAKHRDSGDYASRIKMEKVPGKSGVTDRLVSANDPAAWSIEYGYTAKNGRHVDGLYLVNNTKRSF